MSKLIISAYGSHNAAISMFYKGNYTIVEVERWLNSKNAGLTFYNPSRNPQLTFDEICQWLLDQTDKSEVDVYISGYMGAVRPKFKVNHSIQCDHHMAHAAGAFYQSPYRRSLVFTFDGGGDGGFFNAYIADRNSGIRLLEKFNQDLGFPYMILADYLKDIKKDPLTVGNLVYAGKLMGLCSYGNVREEWLPAFDEFYDKFNYTGDAYLGGAECRFDAITALMQAIGVQDFDFENTSFEGQFAWDIAATTQRAFERQFFKYARPFLDQYPDLPIALSGGCALNVLLNTRLLEERKGEVYVPPNTNDCGISVGGILWHIAPEGQVDLTYSGLPVLDDNRFSEYMEDGRFSMVSDINAKDIARFIADGNILGVIQGNSEHGSRALGNRSIICNPVAGMKDTLNHKVKNREWYRPFAPISRVDDVHRYFDFAGTESRHMVYVAEVKDEWKAVLPAITHEDGTGRLQTLTRQQNELIYDVITEFEVMTGHGVILNTSFNVNGKPILTRLSDALEILTTSKLDAVYYKGNFIFRNGEEKEFYKHRKNEKVTSVSYSDDTTVYAMIFDKDAQADIRYYEDVIAKLSSIRNARVVIMTDMDETYPILAKSRILESRPQWHTVAAHRHHYEKVIRKALPNVNSTTDFAPYLKLLWAKEAMRDNVYNTKNHIFVDVPNCKSMNLVSVVDNMMTNINSELQDSGSSLVTATRVDDFTAPFDKDFYTTKFGRVPELLYTQHLTGGQIDDLNWLFTNHEGIMNWYMSIGKVGSEADYLTVSMMENLQHYRPFFV